MTVGAVLTLPRAAGDRIESVPEQLSDEPERVDQYRESNTPSVVAAVQRRVPQVGRDFPGSEMGWRCRAKKLVAIALPWACIVHLMGISGAVAAAVLKIESILGSGPILGTLGLVLAIAGWWIHRSAAIVLFGLSTCALGIDIFLLIFFLQWSPLDAKRPVPLMLIGYEYLVFPAGLLVVYRLWGGRIASTPLTKLQFGLRHLLIVTTVFAAGSAAIRLAMNDRALPVAIGPGIAGAVFAVILRWYAGFRPAAAP